MSETTPSTLAQLRILARVHLRTALVRLRNTFVESKLMGLTLSVFLVAYLLLGYLLFYHGMAYLQKMPLRGGLLSLRILHLMFFFFFMMLIFSNAVISYTTLFRNRETGWLLTLPIGHRALFTWKVIETLVISSWGMIFLSAPLLAAYGKINGVDPFYYLKSFAAYIPFVILPAAIASWLLLLVVKVVNRWMVICASVGLAAWFISTVFGFYGRHRELAEEGTNVVMTLNQIMEHTSLAVNPLVPSKWMSNSLVYWGRGLGTEGMMFFFLILSYALVGGVITYSVAARFFYPVWNSSNRRRANAAWRRSERGRGRSTRRGRIKIPGVKRSTWALVKKDARTFCREPAQWAQFLIVFGLLAIYVLNLRNMGYDIESPFWSAVITLLNLGVCSLALSTLTTRFIFPQFSLEGRRLWILGMAPFGLDKVLVQKYVLCCLSTALLTVALMVASSIMLRLPSGDVVLYAFVIAVMTTALTALALSLGTLFPNFRESNPAKIVSGFGGTLCLISSFIYILICIALLAIPTAAKLAKEGGFWEFDHRIALVGAILAIGVVSLAVAVFPMIFAFRRVKRLENLGKL